MLVTGDKDMKVSLYHQWLQHGVPKECTECALPLPQVEDHYVQKINFMSEKMDEEDSWCNNKHQNSLPQEGGGVKESIQDAQEKEEEVRDGPSDSSSSEG